MICPKDKLESVCMIWWGIMHACTVVIKRTTTTTTSRLAFPYVDEEAKRLHGIPPHGVDREGEKSIWLHGKAMWNSRAVTATCHVRIQRNPPTFEAVVNLLSPSALLMLLRLFRPLSCRKHECMLLLRLAVTTKNEWPHDCGQKHAVLSWRLNYICIVSHQTRRRQYYHCRVFF